jgi:hypothetical protein
VNILALQSFPKSKEASMVRFVVDNPRHAKAALATEGLSYTEAEVVQVELSHRPGELARVASRLGDADIKIDYAYCGAEPHTHAPLLILGVADAALATAVLDEAAAEDARSRKLRLVSAAGRS